MKTRLFQFLFAVIIISIIGSCTKTGQEGPQGPAGPVFSGGTISGNVSLFDQYGARVLTNVAGIQISIPELYKTTNTDSNGHYLFTGIRTGKYTINAVDTTNNYGAGKAQEIQFLEGDLDKDFKLAQVPTFTLASATAVDTTVAGVNVIELVCSASLADTRQRMIVVFVTADSSSTPNTNNYLITYNSAIKLNKTQVAFLIPVTDLNAAGIISGDKAYFGVYPAAADFATGSDYENLANGRIIYNAVGATPVSCNVKLP